MKAITLDEIWVISLKESIRCVSRNCISLTLPSCLILYAFHTGAAMCIGRKTAGVFFAYGCV